MKYINLEIIPTGVQLFLSVIIYINILTLTAKFDIKNLRSDIQNLIQEI
jgi:hypothetical protein